jgi:hypothetical protein
LDGASTKGLFASEHPYILEFMLMALIPFASCSFCSIFGVLMNSIVFMQPRRNERKGGETSCLILSTSKKVMILLSFWELGANSSQ